MISKAVVFFTLHSSFSTRYFVLNFLEMLGLDPPLSSISYADATPVGHTLVDNIYTGTLMEYKLIGTGLGRRLLDVHGR